MALEAKRAAVRPRVLLGHGGASVLLEEEIRALLAAGASGVVAVIGPSGAGRTTALAHLGAVFPELAGRLCDDASDAEVRGRLDGTLFVYSAAAPRPLPHVAGFTLAPWTRDDLIEYLLARHPSRCGDLVPRLASLAHADLLKGNPRLWTLVLEELLADAALADALSALERVLTARLTGPHLEWVRYRALAMEIRPPRSGQTSAEVEHVFTEWYTDTVFHAELAGLGADVRGLALSDPATLLLARDGMVEGLQRSTPPAWLSGRCEADLLTLVGAALRSNPDVLQRLETYAGGDEISYQPMSASLLLAANPSWRPASRRTTCLDHAHLPGAAWPGIALRGVSLSGANLRKAALPGASLECVILKSAILDRAALLGARLEEVRCENASFVGAALQRTRWHNCDLHAANLTEADLSDADLSACRLDEAILERAVLRRARLISASLQHARFAGADLSEADLSSANLVRADFVEANLSGADLTGAILTDVRFHAVACAPHKLRNAALSGARLDHLDLEGADLQGASLAQADLTGARLRGARLQGAILLNAKLADVDLENADLRHADLRYAVFHMGSSRDGLVGSLIAGEGSRTGFYTDDFSERAFKEPAQIRKANLSGADLRGAQLDGVDLYLVDLRGARLDREHVILARRCGAILGGGAKDG